MAYNTLNGEGRLHVICISSGFLKCFKETVKLYLTQSVHSSLYLWPSVDR